ncbi:prophage protein [Escherichia coli]|uniref:phosphoadenosine phosphosulfate reductase domain-containing protein n=1 Tax=Enterobacteriaceae TaxID=543 RepID=UPI000DA4A4BA|nr:MULTISPECIES: phosphoadenosine phosphosulfate reductase family protein [Enterobacteriaceae]EDR2534718.1 phosphoadenosine phosphosulfate reductase family protein [Salmonella enterica subsp. enterica serovar Saintpaul]EGT2601351.1 phosphoadenosine phosphosulfate reductase family protein [Escherichia coli]EJM1739153.1 phosphoadenosine phosphosulfate reductase family protein [Escherichia coli]EJU0389070.1 phosphoadenosine phosphosulfate reductase family protein [Escherichia coli]EKD0771777.1 ph
MINVVSFSGGRTSAYLLWLMEQKRQAGEDVHYVFMDTGAEHPKTYEFIRNIVSNWKIDLHCLRVIPNPEMGKASSYEEIGVTDIGPDLIPWKRMLNKYGHPYIGGAFCTDRMKSVPFTKYCQEKFGKGNYITWLGIRTDEPNRLKRANGFRYLADISDFEKQDVLDWWSEQKFDLGIQEHLGNCVFCIKKSMQKVALAAMDEPELADAFINILDTEIKTGKEPVMYRGNNTLKSLIALFSDISRDELASRMTSMRQYDSGSCSESCEAFSCQLGFNFEDAA